MRLKCDRALWLVTIDRYGGTDVSKVTNEEMIIFSQKVIQHIFSDIQPTREHITPKIVAWCVYITEEMLVASAFISFFESCWKSSFPGYNKIDRFSDVIDFLTDAAKDAVKSYMKGEVKLMVKSKIAQNYRSIAKGYFSQPVDVSDAERVYDDSDFIPKYSISDRLRELGMKNNL
jgi:hypothetical protein